MNPQALTCLAQHEEGVLVGLVRVSFLQVPTLTHVALKTNYGVISVPGRLVSVLIERCVRLIEHFVILICLEVAELPVAICKPERVGRGDSDSPR
jgi:hypothetical protein